jgi:hypothetical protein
MWSEAPVPEHARIGGESCRPTLRARADTRNINSNDPHAHKQVLTVYNTTSSVAQKKTLFVYHLSTCPLLCIDFSTSSMGYCYPGERSKEHEG